MKDENLEYIRQKINEYGLVSNIDYLKKRKNRKTLSNASPDSFVYTDYKGVPRFPKKNQFGQPSIPVLRRSLIAAKRMYSQTGHPQYKKIITNLKDELKKMNTAPLPEPKLYNSQLGLEKILVNRGIT